MRNNHLRYDGCNNESKEKNESLFRKSITILLNIRKRKFVPAY